VTSPPGLAAGLSDQPDRTNEILRDEQRRSPASRARFDSSRRAGTTRDCEGRGATVPEPVALSDGAAVGLLSPDPFEPSSMEPTAVIGTLFRAPLQSYFRGRETAAATAFGGVAP
jgi:hypothetical protein